MILVHWKAKIGEYVQRGLNNMAVAVVPVYREGHQKFHRGISLNHIIDFVSIHQEVAKEDVIICNIMDDGAVRISLNMGKEAHQ